MRTPRRRTVLGGIAAAVGGGLITEATNDRLPTERSARQAGGTDGRRTDGTDARQSGGTGGQQDDGTRSGGAYAVNPSEGVAGIQRIIDQHGPNVRVALGKGVYAGAELTLDHGVHLVGAGRNATVVRLAEGANTDLVVTPRPDEQAIMQSRFQDITFDGNKENNSSGDVVYGAFWNSRFVDCEFVEAPNACFWLAGSTDGSTDDNYFQGCRFSRAGGDGLRMGLNRESGPAIGVTRVETCWFGDNGGHAVRMRGNGNFVTEGKFYGNELADVMIDRGDRNLILNNDLSKQQPTGPCVAIRAAQGVDSSGNRVAGNTIWGDFQDAVYCHADGNDVVGIQVHDNVVYGMDEQSEGNRTGVLAESEPYYDCSARDNTFHGEFTDEPLQVTSSWETSGNVT